MTYQVIYPYNTTWDEEPVDYEEPDEIEITENLAVAETILPDLFTYTAPSASDMETVEELEQSNNS